MFPWGMFPFNEDIKKLTEQLNPSDVHSYVNDMMKNLMKNTPMDNMISQQTSNSTTTQPPNNGISAQVFETFDDVFVRVHLPENVTLSQLKIFHTSNQAIIENLQGDGSRQVITLPSLVKKKGASAQVKNQILEIKIPRSDDLQYTEITVSEKL
ncbi:Hsp20/alpha crystallin family protein [Lederbergia wuyishanensis]|uniref:HSP20 family molecular chaperone IbpA n=1 Tax=Lederbergia wuyishanensis TaxID=1347903 RepID=A0ABU0D0M2_9BACI|nr:Hsp20/alpha crystallin family protein [Lederbergia wuyishanensis]MCJ8006577.1 Hsp20/alpha crystallin family protein [Lederbergia wuyishanensis]MDQ0341958.1 HSP20 family molecular chaperone IbpA [Lederbergia wuyishanensis]